MRPRREEKRALARCPSCGKNGIRVGLMGGACTACGKTARDVAMEAAGYDPWGHPLPGGKPPTGGKP